MRDDMLQAGAARRAAIELELRRRGRLSFRDFVELALYGDAGYYTAPGSRIGTNGDFITAPEWSPALGACLGRLAARLDAASSIVELGAGRGRLIAPLLEELESLSPARSRLAVVERGPAQRAALVEALGPRARRAELFSQPEELPSQLLETSLVVANELFDALPFHRLRRAASGLEEAWVAWTDEGLRESWRACEDPAIHAHLARQAIELRLGAEAELSLEGPRLVESLGARLGRGLIVIIDYGYSASVLYGEAGSTARAFHRGRLVPDLLARPGEQDLTAHVDFTALAEAGRRAGLEPLVFADQGSFLVGLGAHELPEVRRRNLIRLVHPEQMGSTMKVLVLGRGVSGEVLAGIRNRLPALGLSERP